MVLLWLAACLWISGKEQGRVADPDGDGIPFDEDCSSSATDHGKNANEVWRDRDGDGFGDPAEMVVGCGRHDGWVNNSDDCDDNDALIHPEAQERCDALNNDDNCNGLIDEPGALNQKTWYADVDGDGWGNSIEVSVGCVPPSGYVADPGDCDDTAEAVHPGREERCDGVDNDCDGAIDDDDDTIGDAQLWFEDADGDGWGSAETLLACKPPQGYATITGDCDDTRAGINPSRRERCDLAGRDEDCDGLVNSEDLLPIGERLFFRDADGDGFGDDLDAVEACDAPTGFVVAAGDCDDEAAAIHPDAGEACNAIDDDCDSLVDDDDPDLSSAVRFYLDEDEDGWGDPSDGVQGCIAPPGRVVVSGDCDDDDPARSPSAPEVCGNGDDDCDGLVDDDDPDVIGTSTFWLDIDGDGFGVDGLTLEACDAIAPFAADGGDCDDGDDAVHPSATEACDGVDDDCNGVVDDGASGGPWYADVDGDGFGAGPADTSCVPPDGHVSDATDCDDADKGRNPGATEICDASDVDEDCDGLADDADPEGAAATQLWFPDTDTDGYGDDQSAGTLRCDPVGDEVLDSTDCNDGTDAIHPGVFERPDGTDSDCDGLDTACGHNRILVPGDHATAQAAEDASCDGDVIELSGTLVGDLLVDVDVDVHGPATLDGTVVLTAGSLSDIVLDPCDLALTDAAATRITCLDGGMSANNSLVRNLLLLRGDQGLTLGDSILEQATVFGVDGDGILTNDSVLTGVISAWNLNAGVSGASIVRHTAVWANGTDYVDLDDPTGTHGNLNVDPGFVSLALDPLPMADVPWLAASSLLVDAGHPGDLDPDGSPADIGAFGGPHADFSFYDDLDVDGLPDGWEALFGVDDPLGDPDNDTVLTEDELADGTHPDLADSDGDGTDDDVDPDPLDPGVP